MHQVMMTGMWLVLVVNPTRLAVIAPISRENPISLTRARSMVIIILLMNNNLIKVNNSNIKDTQSISSSEAPDVADGGRILHPHRHR